MHQFVSFLGDDIVILPFAVLLSVSAGRQNIQNKHFISHIPLLQVEKAMTKDNMIAMKSNQISKRTYIFI